MPCTRRTAWRVYKWKPHRPSPVTADVRRTGVCLRFRIQTVLLLVALLAIFLLVADITTRGYRHRRHVESDLRSMGAYYVAFNENNEPNWVGFVAPNHTDRIAEYKSFEHIDLAGANVTDLTIRHLSKLERIGTLHLTECNVTDTQLGLLSDIGSIWMLRLNGSPISDAAIPAIASLRDLKSLDVSGTLISPDGVAELKRRVPDIVVRQETQ